MKTGIVQSSLISRFKRLDVGFLLYAQQYLPVVDELVAKFPKDVLRYLAETLPFDQKAAAAVVPGQFENVRQKFDAWLKAESTRSEQIAVYVAAAADGARAKIKAKADELRRLADVELERAEPMFKSIEFNEAKLLMEIINKGTTADA